jgi:methylmalonyl-CoA mutase N-terminal domain/subunit
MPLVIEAARAHVTEGEIMGALREVFGEYTDPGIL